MNSIRIALLVAAAAVAPGLLPAPSMAADSPGVHVSYADLDLSTQKGVDALYRRINRAAGQYCDDVLWRTGTRIASGHAACVADAVSNTVRTLNVPSLTALHAERSRTDQRS